METTDTAFAYVPDFVVVPKKLTREMLNGLTEAGWLNDLAALVVGDPLSAPGSLIDHVWEYLVACAYDEFTDKQATPPT